MSRLIRPFDIVNATANDAQELAQVHVASWFETYPGLVPQALLESLTVDSRAKGWRNMLSQPARFANVKAFLARVDGLVIGAGACNRQRNERLLQLGFDAEISSLYVLKSYQCRGIGETMMRVMASRLIIEKHSGVGIWVLKYNEQARQFYEHLGGMIVAEKSDVRAYGTLKEIAYGWSRLESLI